ncbi:RHS repeat-associated core domain-containing protein [Treponema denticola ATCC 33520]|uniref:RHS repeat domain-containing protein n=1 Tax=Treponema denticola TaxID=158 RepID=UPI0002B5CE6F|nr:RHS repeat-associated core domain-containing protein [Treponema denticola]EMB39889.1 RHS repeat-associated core domain-containing protein [Treponema denticola ATCC 33520]
MKTNLYFYSQLNYLPRTAIEAEILFAVCLSKKKALTGGKFLAREDKYSKKIGVKSAVLTLVYFYIIMIVHKCQQSAKRKLLLNKNNLSDVFPLTVGSGKTMAFENRRGKYKEIGKKVPQAYRVYVEHLFLRSDAGDARIFSKEGNMTNKLSTTNIPGSQGNSYPKAELDYNLNYEYDPAYAHRLIHAGTRYYRYDANGNITAEKDGPFTDEEEFTFTYSYFENEDVYGTDYGFGLDAPKETEQANPQDLFAYRRNYTWNERNLLTKSSDRNFTVHYRYGEDGQRALKYTDEGRSETLYFNNFFTIHIPTQDQNNPQGLRVHKHIFVGNSRLVTAMTHTDNYGDNEEQKVKRYYYHSDHLGSAQFVTDWKGRQYEHIEYTPYGELWIEEVAAGLDKLPFRFTGKELDEETGFYYYGARYLDPKYSRWLSGDPALNDYIPQAPVNDEAKKHNENLPGMGGVFNVVNLHVYHYAGNNPVKYVDPDGKKMVEGDYIRETNLSFPDMIYLWDTNNKKYNYSKSILGWFGIGQSSIDAGLMVGEWGNLFRGIAKDIAGVVGSASTIISVITAIMPDPEGEAKQKWDKFLASYVDDRGEAIDGTRKDIKLIRSRKVTLKKYTEQRGPIIVFGVKARVKETTELSYINKDGKEIRELIKEEIWDEY